MDTFEDYQRNALLTASYPDRGRNLVYPALGVADEAGELAEKVKKLWRNHGITSGDFINCEICPTLPVNILRDGIIAEAGDVLWYLAAIAYELGISLEEIAQKNLAKLADRRDRNVIKFPRRQSVKRESLTFEEQGLVKQNSLKRYLKEKEINIIRGKCLVGKATSRELMSVFEHWDLIEMELEKLDYDDFFGTEGWRHFFGLPDSD